jgi:hypothetical protein
LLLSLPLWSNAQRPPAIDYGDREIKGELNVVGDATASAFHGNVGAGIFDDAAGNYSTDTVDAAFAALAGSIDFASGVSEFKYRAEIAAATSQIYVDLGENKSLKRDSPILFTVKGSPFQRIGETFQVVQASDGEDLYVSLSSGYEWSAGDLVQVRAFLEDQDSIASATGTADGLSDGLRIRGLERIGAVRW